MNVDAVRRNVTARLLAGRPLPLVGRLLAAQTRMGEIVALDPATGGELAAADDRPAFVLSTEHEATDRHIVRQHWDLSRAGEGGPGVPILWNHNSDVLLGQWQDLSVQTIDDKPALVGRAYFDPEDSTAQHRKGQVKRGILNAVSIGWMAGATVRRSELDPADPNWREAEDGICGPEEGLVMGTPEEPNRLVETSMVPCPAQQQAVVTERLHQAGVRDFDRAMRGEPYDADRLLAFLAAEPRVRAFLRAELTSIVRAEQARTRSPTPAEPTLADFFKRS